MMKWWSKISVKHVVDLHVLAEVSHEHLTLRTNKLSLRAQPFLQAPHREHSNTTQHSNAQQWASPRCSLPTSTADWFETTDKQQKLHGTAIPNSLLSLFFQAHWKLQRHKIQILYSSFLRADIQALPHENCRWACTYTRSCAAYIYLLFFFTLLLSSYGTIHFVTPWVDLERTWLKRER